MTIHLSDMAGFESIGGLCEQYLSTSYLAQAISEVDSLGLPDLEVEAMAIAGDGKVRR